MSASADPTKDKDSLMKMLLTNSNVAYPKNLDLGTSSDRDLIQKEDNLHETFVSYIQALAGSSRPISLVWMEHSYARAVGGGGGARLLLVRRAPQCPDCHAAPNEEPIIDVESVDSEPTPPLLLDELPQVEKAPEPGELIPEDEDTKTDWEEKLHSLAWNASQGILLSGALSAVLAARTALLAVGRAGARRAAARGGAARSLRALLAAPPVRWQPRLTQWLHNALIEHLPPPLLACYKDIMLTLKSKVPTLVERMTLGHPLAGRVRGAENGSGGPTIASGNPSADSTGPLILLLPSGRDRRDARWAERLRPVAEVQVVHSHQSNWPLQLPLSACLSQLIGLGRARANALRAEFPQRPLVLVGQGAGAAIAVQLAVSVVGVAGVVCLGLPLLTCEGPRGGPDDCLLDLPCPALFIVGQNGSQCNQQDAEAIRCKLRVRSRLVVAGGADDLLRLPRLKRHLEGVTQRMLECAIADEVGGFLSCLLQWEAEGGGRSSPDSTEGSAEPLPPPPMLKRRPIDHPSQPKKKRIRNKPLKVTSPIKSRGVALFQVNNPPPEGASISMGQLLSTSVKDDYTEEEDDDPFGDSRNSISPLSRKEPSFIQISNAKLGRSITITGNGTTTDTGGNTIKVLENIAYNPSRVPGSRVMGSISGPANTPIMLPRKQVSKAASPAITSTNIMDIPIIFADDDKAVGNQSVSHQISPTTGIKTIIINKQQVLGKSVDGKRNPSSSQVSPRSIMKVKMSPVGVKTSLGQVLVGSSANQPMAINRPNMTNKPLKYTKVILAKRTPDLIGNNSGTSPTKMLETSGTKTSVTSKPIIVKGKGGPLTTFKVIPGTVFPKGSKMLGSNQQLIIKRAVTSGGVTVNPLGSSVRKRNEILRENMASDRAIEAAVASITGDQDK